MKILQDYRQSNSDMVLVATDVAARGLDIDDIDVVIQQTVNNVDSFVHRTGRTGRAGKTGRNIVLFDCDGDKQGLDFFRKIETSLKCSFKFTNQILNSTADNPDAAAEQLALEQKRVDKIGK